MQTKQDYNPTPREQDNSTQAREQDLYEYAVIRYVPCVEREEFINIGLIMMCKRKRWISVRIEIDETRLGAFRSQFSKAEVTAQASLFEKIAGGSPAYGPLATLPVEERFRWLTAVKSSSLQTSRPHPGLTPDLDRQFNHLFAQYVS